MLCNFLVSISPINNLLPSSLPCSCRLDTVSVSNASGSARGGTVGLSTGVVSIVSSGSTSKVSSTSGATVVPCFLASSVTFESSLSKVVALGCVNGPDTPPTTPPSNPPATAASSYSLNASSLSKDKPACSLSINCCPTSVTASVGTPVNPPLSALPKIPLAGVCSKFKGLPTNPKTLNKTASNAACTGADAAA